MHLNTLIERVWTSTWRLRSHGSRDGLGNHRNDNLEINLEAMIVQTGRPWFYQFGDTLGGRERRSLQMHFEGMINQDRHTWRW